MTETIGALILGGNLNGLSIARSLGRQGVPVWVATTPDIRLASFSRYAEKTVLWPIGEAEAQAAYLLELADRHPINQWVLFPTSDETAAFLSQFYAVLSPQYRVSTPKWEVLRWAYDKRLTYQLAAHEEVDYPTTFCPTDEGHILDAPLEFPAILKPATHAVMSRFTSDKAWPVANREELLARYREAQDMIPSDEILVQERIPGGGESQFSYAALYRDGEPIATLTARRTRQYPVDFGYSSSFVETMSVPEIVDPSHRMLSAIRYTGLVEVEYKLDRRNGLYKLLDINPRLWTWATLGAQADMDFPYLLWRMMTGKHLRKRTAAAGFRWVRMTTDIPSAIHEMFRGRLPVKSYLHSLRSPIEFALMAADDPLPGLLDLPLYVFKRLYNGYQSLRGTLPMRADRIKG